MRNKNFINQAEIDICLELTAKNKGIKISFEKGKIIHGIEIENKNLNFISFEETTLHRCRFKNLNLSEVNFYNSMLNYVVFENCEEIEKMEEQLGYNSNYQIIINRGQDATNTIDNPRKRRKQKKQTVYDEIKKTIPKSEIDEIKRQR